MDLQPVVIPAREAVSYDLYRVSMLTITQDGFGKPLYCNIKISRGRMMSDGTAENAPPETEVNFSEQIGIDTLLADHPEVAAAMYTINAFAATVGVKKGFLKPAQ